MAQRDELTAAVARIAKLETEVEDLKRFRSWMMGIGAGIGAIFAFFADAIRKRLGL